MSRANTDSDADYEAVLAAVNVLAKANAGLDADVATGDEDDAAEVRAAGAAGAPTGEDADEDEEGDEDEGLAKAVPDQFVDAAPLVEALLTANNRLAKGQMQLLREVRQMRSDQGVMAKAHGLLLTQNRDLREEIEALGTGGAGRRSAVTRSAAPLAKSPQVIGTGHPLDAIAGVDLLAKATAASLTGDLLTGREITQVNEYVNMGHGYSGIREMDPQLAGRVEAAINSLPAASA